MDIQELLKEHKMKQKEFANLVGYTEAGLIYAMKRKRTKDLLYSALIYFLLKRKGISPEQLLIKLNQSLL